MPQVTVSVPYYRSPSTIRRAVNAILAQTHVDLVCIVINDGDTRTPPWPYLQGIEDPRLVRFDLPANRGRYHADAVTLAATRTEWWTVHDADDAARPTWLQTQLRLAEESGADAVFCGHTVTDPSGVTTHDDPATPHVAGEAVTHHAHMAGLWRTEFVRVLGGPRPDVRIGYDTLLTGAALATGRAVITKEVLYDRYLQTTSLTRSAATRSGSPARRAASDWVARMWSPVTVAARRGPDAAGAALRFGVPKILQDEVVRQAEILESVMTSSLPELASVPWADCLADESLWGDWALNADTAQALALLLEEGRPRRIVESGSGSTTLLFSQYCDAHGARLTSLESGKNFRDRTANLLKERGTGESVDLVYAPLVGEKDKVPWYAGTDSLLPLNIDFALVDGPREMDGGRMAALRHLMPHMGPDSTIVLDDADRPDERRVMGAWSRLYGLEWRPLDGSRGTASVAHVPPALDVSKAAEGVVVTILTGRRPQHLARTLGRLRLCAPGLLESAHVIVLHNGGDRATGAEIDRHRDVIDESWYSEALGTIGEATSQLAMRAEEAGRAQGRNYWLHLEDDWAMIPPAQNWLAEAQKVLAARRGIYQVRMRTQGDVTLDRHMVTGRRLVWMDYGAVELCMDAHYTCNPALMRVSDISKVWPAEGERAAQVRARAAHLKGVARLVQGVFAHGGEAMSLRRESQCPA